MDMIGYTNFGQSNWVFSHSPGGLFTLGSPGSFPTAIDESDNFWVGTGVGGVWFGNGEEGGNPQYVVNLLVSEDLTCCRETFWLGGKNFGNLFFDAVDDPTPGWANPNFALAERTQFAINATSTCARLDFYVYEPPSPFAAGLFIGHGPHGTMTMYGSVEGSVSGGAFVRSLPELLSAKNKISGTYRFGDGRSGLYAPIAGADGGYHGRIFDLWWCQYRQITALFNPGDTVPLAGNKEFVIIGDYMLPWNGTAFRTT
jgi:hypothetical protein